MRGNRIQLIRDWLAAEELINGSDLIETVVTKKPKDEVGFSRSGTEAPEGQRCGVCKWFVKNETPCLKLYGKTYSESYCDQYEPRSRR